MYDQIVVFPDYVARTKDNIVYFDNISFNSITGGSGGGGADAGMGTGAPAAGAAAPATAGALAEAAAACAGAAPASAGTSRPMARFASRDRLSRCSGISVNVAPTAYFGEILLSETAQTDYKINDC